MFHVEQRAHGIGPVHCADSNGMEYGGRSVVPRGTVVRAAWLLRFGGREVTLDVRSVPRGTVEIVTLTAAQMFHVKHCKRKNSKRQALTPKIVESLCYEVVTPTIVAFSGPQGESAAEIAERGSAPAIPSGLPSEFRRDRGRRPIESRVKPPDSLKPPTRGTGRTRRGHESRRSPWGRALLPVPHNG